MGIAGLLNVLKPIQVTRHLSEYAGKTIAVDAYVWLHKSIHTCAIELATGKPTHKYVDYAMHRVRLLRHFQIEPYIVFDGGPLPAKKGTESSRKQKRDENLEKGKALLAKGKTKEARLHFVKSIDITPQMVFQFIKALRAESVTYLVAPYEADAQLAYLERTGIVDAILTEDSDLLVYGCQNVLYKLDPVAYTVVSISRSDFGSVINSDGMSLVGWSDKQFREWCILSGCDYLPSIHGIGLKTAWFLLRKWRTVDKVVKSIALEGKKTVPAAYMKDFALADKCFQHQRVYCPKREKLVHMTEVEDAGWTQEFDNYVGPDIDPSMAKQIAMGDADPETYEPMPDIYPFYTPRPLRRPQVFKINRPIRSPQAKVPTFLSPKASSKMRLPLPPPSPVATASKNTNTNKEAAKPVPKGGIMTFFGPNPIIPASQANNTAAKKQAPVMVTTGKASGKRTLAQAMDEDVERRANDKAKARKTSRRSYSPAPHVASVFFAAGPKSNDAGVKRRYSDGIAVAGPSKLPAHGANKENVTYIVIDHEEEEIVEEDVAGDASDPDLAPDASDVSVQAAFYEPDTIMNDEEFIDDAVQQEDGYLSPSPTRSRDGDELSSPVQPGPSGRRKSKMKALSQDASGLFAQTGFIPSDDDGPHGVDVIEHEEDEEETSFGGADFVSSPVSVKRPGIFDKFAFMPRGRMLHTPARPRTLHEDVEEEILVEPTPTPTGRKGYGDANMVGMRTGSPRPVLGPDLRHMLGDEQATELDALEDDAESDYGRRPGSSSTPPSLSPDTPGMPPPGQGPPRVKVALAEDVDVDVDVDDGISILGGSDDDARLAREAAERSRAVLLGWREKWSHTSVSSASAKGKAKALAPAQAPNVIQPIRREGSGGSKKPQSGPGSKGAQVQAQAQSAGSSSTLRRSETNVTPMGRHALGRSKNKAAGALAAPQRFPAAAATATDAFETANARRSLMFSTTAVSAAKVTTSTTALASKARKVVDLTLDP